MARSFFHRDSQPLPPPDDDARVAESWLREVLPEAYFINAARHDMPRHRVLLEKLRDGDVLTEFHNHRLGRLTELTLCAFDDDEPGLLAKVSGALASLGIELRTAYAYTIEAAKLPQHTLLQKRVAFDILFLCRRRGNHDRALNAEQTEQTRDTLSRVLAGRESVGETLRKTLRRPAPPLQIEELTITKNATPDGLTRVALRARDSAGLLAHAATSLAALGLDIRVAQLNTVEKTADGVFYVVCKSGQPLSASPETLTEELRAALEQRAAD